MSSNKWSFLLLAGLALTAVSCGRGGNDQPTAPITAALYEVSGTVQTLKPEEGLFQDAANGQVIGIRDQVLTYENGRARVDISNGTIVRVGPLTTFTLEEMENTPDGVFALFKLDIGELWIILNGGQVNVDTPAGLASVRGSFLNVIVAPDTGETLITCLEGTCTLSNDGGTVVLSAGQTARILNANTPPETGTMDDQDIQRWLDANPEATLVVVPLSPTAETASDTPVPPTDTTEPGQPTSTPAPSNTAGAAATATPTATAIQCGPPAGWTLYTVKSGETLFSLANAFQVTVSDLQVANCLGASTTIIAGQGLFTPNIATITPSPTSTPTITPTRTNTAVVAPSNTSAPTLSPTPKTPTATRTPTVTPTFTPTMSGSGTNAVFANPIGPDITSIGTCTNFYSINVTDPDGVMQVKLVYSVNDPGFSSPNYELLFDQGGGTYARSLSLDTSANAGTDTVYYRFQMIDVPGWTQTYPAAPRSFTDSLDCGATPTATPTPDPNTYFSAITAPAGGSTIATCSNLFSVTVTDFDGVMDVFIEFSVNDPTFSTPFPYYFALNYMGSDTWEAIANLDTSTDGSPGNDTVYWRFKATDFLYNTTRMPASGSVNFIDPFDCSGF